MNVQAHADQHRKESIDKSQKMIKLLDNDLFKELIMEGYIKAGTYENSIHGNLDNPNTIDELKGRQGLHKFIFAIMTQGEILSSQK